MEGQQYPAGWYKDWAQRDVERYWDGAAWTERTRLAQMGTTPAGSPGNATGSRGKAIGLGLVGCFLLVVGGHDAFRAGELTSRLLGFVLAAVGGLQLVAAGGLIRHARWSTSVGLLASASGAAVALFLLAAHINSDDVDGRAFLWLAMLVGMVISAYSFRRGWLGLPTSLRRPGGLVTSVVSVLAAAGIIQIIYSTQYLPRTIEPSLSVETTLRRVPGSETVEVVEARTKVTNISAARVVVLGSLTNLVGVKQTEAPVRAVRADNFAEALKSGREGYRGSISRKAEVIQTTASLAAGSNYFAPEAVSEFRRIYRIRRAEYNIVVVQVTLVVAKDVVMDIGPRISGPTKVEGRPGTVGVRTAFPLTESSWIRELTRGNRAVYDFAVLGQPNAEPSPRLAVYVDRIGRHQTKPGADPYNRRMANVYGLSLVRGYSELALPDD